MTCEKSRIRDLMRIWQMSRVGRNWESEKEQNLRGTCEKNLLKFKTGARRVKWLHAWAEGETAVTELEEEK